MLIAVVVIVVVMLSFRVPSSPYLYTASVQCYFSGSTYSIADLSEFHS